MSNLLPSGLTEKQAAFVQEYPVDFNGTKAAIRAGYAVKGAHAEASRLLRNVKVMAALGEIQTRDAERVGVTREGVVEELRRIGFADPRDLFVWDKESCTLVPSDQLSDEAVAVVSGVKARTTTVTDGNGNQTKQVEVELKTHSKIAALDKLAKHLGMFEDTRPMLPGAGSVVVPTQINVYLPDNNRSVRAEVVSSNGKGDL